MSPRIGARLALMLALALGGAGVAQAESDALERDFVAAGEAYRAGRYEQALGRYEGLLVAGWRNGPLFYDLGNAYFQTGQLGEAVRAYRRAALYMPRDPDLRHNRSIAEGTVADTFSRTGFGYMLSSLAFWQDRTTLVELTWAVVLAGWAVVIALAVRLERPGRASRAALGVALGLLAMAGASAGAKLWQLRVADPAIVLAPEAEVRAGPSYRETVTATLPEGLAVELRGEEEGAYLRVELPDGRDGWVRREQLGRVRLDPGPRP